MTSTGRPEVRTSSSGLWFVLIVAVAVRFWGIWNSGFTHWDEHIFVEQARHLAANWSAGVHNLGWTVAPMMSFLMGMAMRVLGPDDWVALSVAAGCGALACVATTLLGRACYGHRVGVLAGLILAVSPFAFSYSRLALAESLFLLLFLMVTLCVWHVGRHKGIAMAAAGGILTGVLTMTKFSGVYGVLLIGAWLSVGAFRTWYARRSDDVRVSNLQIRRRLIVFLCWMAGFGAVVVTLLPLILPKDGGLSTFLSYYAAHSSLGLGTDPRVIVTYLAGATAWPIVAACGVGLVVAAVRRTDGDLFLLLVFLSFFAAVTRYVAFPRLGLPLAPLAAIFAAVGSDWIAARASRSLGSRVFPAIGLALLVPQLFLLAPIAALRTRGYADAARVVDGAPANVDVWSRSQMSLMLYSNRPRWLACSPAVAASLATDQERLFVLDQVATWSGLANDLLARNAGHITGETLIPNPMYTELLLQPFSWEQWDRRNDPPSAYKFIRIVGTRGPLQMPPGCP